MTRLTAARLAALLTALGCIVLALLPRPRLDNSIEAMLVDDSPPALRYAAFKARFGADEVIVVHATASTAEALLPRVAALEATLARDPGVAATLGPATAYADEFALLLDPDLGGFTELPRLAPRFDGPLDPALDLIDLDPPAARLYAFCRPGHPDDRRRLAAALDAARADLTAHGGALHAAGPPLLNLALDDAGREVETTALPALVAVCVALLITLTRSLRTTLAALLPVGLGVLAAEGLLTATGHSADIIVNIAKPLLFVLLLATGLHIIVAWQDHRRAGHPPATAPWTAARHKARACTLALGTTALGFASLIASEVPSIRTFGLLTAAGLGLGLPLLLLLLPALLVHLAGPITPRGAPTLGRLAARAITASLNHPRLAITTALLLTLTGLAAIPALPISTGGVHYFDDDARIRRDYEAITAAGVGLSTIELVIAGPALTAPDRLEAITRYATAIEAIPGAHATVGLPLFLREAHWRLTGTDALPAPTTLEEALTADALAPYRPRDGHLRLSLLIDHLDAPALDALYTALRATFAQHLAPHDLTLTLTGHHELVVAAQSHLVDTLLWSLLGTLILIEAIIIVALRSPRLALAALLPTTLPVALNFALMWLLGIPLDLGTCMTGAIAIGIAVDDALHFMDAWRREDPRTTAHGTGRAMVLTSIVIAAGFASLTTAAFTPTARFGLLAATAMATALLADLLVLPALLARLAPRPDPTDQATAT
ncbi:MAG: MMPL family transporter [bacterium]